MAETVCASDGAVVHKLANGLTIAMEQLPYLHSATAGIWIRAGSADERREEAGLAHFLEHLFFKGTKTRSVHEIMRTIEGRGGHVNAFTSREHTCLYVKSLDSHVATGIEILADILKNSIFADLEKERNVVLEEIASIEDAPEDYVHDLLSEFHWPDHPMGRPISGTVESVSKLGLEDVRNFYASHYGPDRMILSIAGSFDADAVLAQLTAELEGLSVGPAPERCAAPEFRHGIEIFDREIAQANVCMAFPAPRLGDDRRFVCDLTSSILGGGSTSRLFERIREEEGLAYTIYSFHSFYEKTGMLGICAGVAPNNYGKTLELTLDELRRLCNELVSEEELAMNREQLKGSLLMALENTSARMSYMAKSLMHYGRLISVDELTKRLDTVSAEDVQRFAQETFREDCCALVVLGPTGGYQIDRVAL